MMRRRLELKIKEGNYHQIANIPRVLSKLSSEIDTLKEQVAKVPKRDFKLAETIKKKIDRTNWLIKELNSHREIEVREVKQESCTLGDLAEMHVKAEPSEFDQQ